MNRKTLMIIVAVLVLAVAGYFIIKKNRQVSIPTPGQTTAKTENEAPRGRFVVAVPITYHVEKQFEFPIGEGEAINPSVSPDGAKIVFIRKTGEKHSLSIAELPTGRISGISIPIDQALDPSWSADGAKITFAGARQGVWEIYLYDLKTGKLSQVTNDPKRKKSHPRCSPHPFDDNHRIAYVSEEKGRKDIWWVRESGRFDQPITVAPERVKEFQKNPAWEELGSISAPTPETVGGDMPEWSPSGNILIYRTAKGNSVLAYNHQTWWMKAKIPLPVSTGSILSWAPNQTAFLEYNPARSSAAVVPRSNLKAKTVLAGRHLSSAPAYFPDGRGFAYVVNKNDRSYLAVEPYDDPLGDVANLWMFPYSQGQKQKLADNQMLLLTTDHDQIYTMYDSERYSCGADAEIGFHARPYIVTSDAVLETFYAAFAALYATVEREELKNALEEFSREGARVAREKRVSKDVETLFLTGLVLLKPENASITTPEAREEAARVQAATGKMHSLFNHEEQIDYGDFFIRGKYERDRDLQGYFRAIKWFQAFTLDLNNKDDRRFATEIMAVSNSPNVRPSLERIYALYRAMIGESRYLNPTNIKEMPATGQPSPNNSGLPWIKPQGSFRLLPSIYTIDAYVFDELIYHSDRTDTVGTASLPRMLPRGLDVLAAFGSNEARDILLHELKEGRYANYEKKLSGLSDKIRTFSGNSWNTNLYQNWMSSLSALVSEPGAKSPAFTKSKAWKRKQLNSAMGSWVNLRYETIAVVEQVSAECGEGGYERLDVGMPRGYVEPDPEFFHRLDEGFGKLAAQMERAIKDPALKKGTREKIAEYRKQLQALEVMARKELDRQPLTDEEYTMIFNIGGTIEHFIILMGSLNVADDKGDGSAIRAPEPLRKIVDIQKNPLTGERLYEALGYVSEINVAVPYYGRRVIVKGPIYSYHEFTSRENLDSAKWRASGRQPPPVWLRPFYDGKGTAPLGKLSDFDWKP